MAQQQDMVFGFAGFVMVVVHSAHAPSPKEFNDFIAELAKHDPEKIRLVVYTKGASLDGLQRKKMIDTLGGRQCTIAVLSDSAIVRGAVTALSWFNSKIKAFAPDRLPDAFQHINASKTEIPLIEYKLRELLVRIDEK